jgi:hypothetical protein
MVRKILLILSVLLFFNTINAQRFTPILGNKYFPGKVKFSKNGVVIDSIMLENGDLKIYSDTLVFSFSGRSPESPDTSQQGSGDTTITSENIVLSPDDPIADYTTLAQLQSALNSFNPGDTVFIEKGHEYSGILDVTQEGLVFTAYGTGNNPVITGKATADGLWSNIYGNVWRYDMGSSIDVRTLLVNGDPKVLGRYPNHPTYLSVDNDVREITYEMIDTDLTQPNGYFDDCEAVIRTTSWNISTVDVEYYRNDTVNFVQNTRYEPDAGTPVNYYFFQNDTVTLDQEWEWCTSNQYLYVYSITNPNDSLIEYTESNYDLLTISANNIKIENIDLSLTNGFGINAVSIDSFTYDGGKISYVQTGIDISHSNNILLQNFSIEYAGMDGINLGLDSNTIIQDFTIEKINHIPGMFVEYTSSQIGYGIYSDIEWTNQWQGNWNTLVQRGSFDLIGCAGFRASYSDSAIIQDSKFTKNSWVTGDGAAVYTWHTGSEYTSTVSPTYIRNNFIDADYTGSYTLAMINYSEHPDIYGVYIDDRCDGINIDSNLIVNASSDIFVHNSHNIDITNNTTLNFDNAGVYLSDDGIDPDTIYDITMSGNVYGWVPNQTTQHTGLRLRERPTPVIHTENTFEDNLFIKYGDNIIAYPDLLVYMYSDATGNHNWNLSNWKTESGSTDDTLSFDISLYTTPADSIFMYEFNFSNSPLSIDSKITEWNNAGYVLRRIADGVEETIKTLQPYEYVIYIADKQ